MPHSLPRKLRNQLIRLVVVLLVLTAALNLSLSYRYAHLPLRSAVIPQPYKRIGLAADGLVFSRDGKELIVTDTQTGLSQWSVPNLHFENRTEHQVADEVSTAYLSPDGDTLAFADSQAVHRWAANPAGLRAIPTKQVQFRQIVLQKSYWRNFFNCILFLHLAGSRQTRMR